MSPPDSKLLELIAPVQDGVERMRAVLSEDLGVESKAVADMTAHIARFRGKQLRGALVLLVGQATENTSDEHPEVASIVELIHLATLVHDDVLDGAKVRRRVACVNQRWDNQVAVLLGDFLYARAFGRSTQLSSRLCSEVLARTTQRICAAEIDQAASRYEFEMPQERYEAIAGAKTASLYAAACELGARYPEGRESIGEDMRRLGWDIGLAFQIIDDCLDVVADGEVVGKDVGNDIQDGKVTLPVLHIYRTADEELRGRIRDVYMLQGLDRRAERLRDVCDLEPGVEYALARARELVDGAMLRLRSLPASPARTAMENLAQYVLQRRW